MKINKYLNIIRKKTKNITIKIDSNYFYNVLFLLFIFYWSKKNIEFKNKLKKDLKTRNFDVGILQINNNNDFELYLNQICTKVFDFNKSITNQFLDIVDTYNQLYTLSLDSIELKYFYKYKNYNYKDHFANSEKFSNVLAKSKNFKNKVMSYLDFNYSLMIEFARNSIKRNLN